MSFWGKIFSLLIYFCRTSYIFLNVFFNDSFNEFETNIIVFIEKSYNIQFFLNQICVLKFSCKTEKHVAISQKINRVSVDKLSLNLHSTFWYPLDDTFGVFLSSYINAIQIIYSISRLRYKRIFLKINCYRIVRGLF